MLRFYLLLQAAIMLQDSNLGNLSDGAGALARLPMSYGAQFIGERAKRFKLSATMLCISPTSDLSVGVTMAAGSGREAHSTRPALHRQRGLGGRAGAHGSPGRP
jgi:hypothetical protein